MKLKTGVHKHFREFNSTTCGEMSEIRFKLFHTDDAAHSISDWHKLLSLSHEFSCTSNSNNALHYAYVEYEIILLLL